MPKTVEDYLDLPYTIEITHDRDDEGNEGFVADVRELPGCITQGATLEEAARRVRDALRDWLTVALEDGIEIPKPRARDAFSGRFLLRVPRGLHAELAREAARQGVSLNQYVATTLAGVVGWKQRGS